MQFGLVFPTLTDEALDWLRTTAVKLHDEPSRLGSWLAKAAEAERAAAAKSDTDPDRRHLLDLDHWQPLDLAMGCTDSFYLALQTSDAPTHMLLVRIHSLLLGAIETVLRIESAKVAALLKLPPPPAKIERSDN